MAQRKKTTISKKSKHGKNATENEWNMKKKYRKKFSKKYRKSAARKVYNKRKMQPEKSSKWKSATWKNWNTKWVQDKKVHPEVSGT